METILNSVIHNVIAKFVDQKVPEHKIIDIFVDQKVLITTLLCTPTSDEIHAEIIQEKIESILTTSSELDQHYLTKIIIFYLPQSKMDFQQQKMNWNPVSKVFGM